MLGILELSPHIQEIILNIKAERDLQNHLLMTDEDEGTGCPVEKLYKASLEKEKTLYTYLGVEVFNYFLENELEFYRKDINEIKS